MIRIMSNLYGYTIRAEDGDIGQVHDFYIDDQEWIVRYLVADTSVWLPGKKVLIATDALDKPSWDDRAFPVHLTREQVESCPDIEQDKPVSLQYQTLLHEHFGWTPYWQVSVQAEEVRDAVLSGEDGDPHLRSALEITDYVVQAKDGEAGYIEDFVIEDVGWKVQYLMVDDRKWLPGKKVLLLPQWVQEFNFPKEQMLVNVMQESIKECPACDPSNPAAHAYVKDFQDHFRRMEKWDV